MTKELTVGDKVPNFTGQSIEGEAVTLNGGDKDYTLLAFLRYAGCPWCNLTVLQLTRELPEFDKHNCRIICFIQSDKDEIQKQVVSRQKQYPGFTIVADPKMEIYQQFGIKYKKPFALHLAMHIPSWLNAVFIRGFSQKKSKDADLFLIPGAFIADNNTKQIIYANYNAHFYSHDSFAPAFAAMQDTKL